MAKYTDEQIKMFDSEEEYRQYIINRQEAKIDRLNNELRLKVDYIHEQRDVIDEKKAEIERLQTEADRYKRYYFNHEYDKLIAEAKSEAIKECTKKLKSIFGEWIFSYKTEDLFKELVGESNV